jgi:hypothetical protein
MSLLELIIYEKNVVRLNNYPLESRTRLIPEHCSDVREFLLVTNVNTYTMFDDVAYF